MTGYAIEASGLVKRFGEVVAVDGFDIRVNAGTVFGLLGPNGAGKTTVVRSLATLERLNSGRATVCGFDVGSDARQVRKRIGLTAQQTAVDEVLTARQNMMLYGRLYRMTRAQARIRGDELLDQFGLTEVADRQVKEFSGGMQRRLDIAASIMSTPEVLFFDEPTTGLDPVGRGEVWDAVLTLASEGTTVLLTTHYLDEADRLCDRISVIDRGRNVVEDTPAGLKRQAGNERLEVVAVDPAVLPSVSSVLGPVALGEPVVDLDRLAVTAVVTDGVAALTQVATTIRAEGIVVADIGLRRPTLDGAFLHLVGNRGAS